MRVVFDTFDENKGFIENDDGKKYYFKLNSHDCIEIVVERIAKQLGICCAHYGISSYDGKELYVSDSLNNDGEFILAQDLNIDGTNLFAIWRGIEKFYPQHVKLLMNDMIKIYIMDLLLMNFDRTDLNWGFYIKDNNVRIAIIDSELAFSISSSYISCEERKNPFGLISINDDNIEILKFLSVSSKEFVDLFARMYRLLTPEYIENVFLGVEKDIGRSIVAKDICLRIYNEHYQEIGEVIKGTKGLGL